MAAAGAAARTVAAITSVSLLLLKRSIFEGILKLTQNHTSTNTSIKNDDDYDYKYENILVKTASAAAGELCAHGGPGLGRAPRAEAL